MSTKQQKRITKQVRIPEKWHRLLKIDAASSGLTISKLLDAFLNKHYLESKKTDV